MIVSTSLMMGDMSESVASRSRSRTSSPASVSLTSEMRKPGGGLLQYALGGIASAQDDVDRPGGGHIRNHRACKAPGQFIQSFQISRIRHGDAQPFGVSAQRHELVAHHQVDGDFGERVVVDRRFAVVRQEIDVRQTITTGEVFGGAHLRWIVILWIGASTGSAVRQGFSGFFD